MSLLPHLQEWYSTQGHNSVTSSPARGLPGSNALDKKRDERGREVQVYDPESAVLHVREVDVGGGGWKLDTIVCGHAIIRCALNAPASIGLPIIGHLKGCCLCKWLNCCSIKSQIPGQNSHLDPCGNLSIGRACTAGFEPGTAVVCCNAVCWKYQPRCSLHWPTINEAADEQYPVLKSRTDVATLAYLSLTSMVEGIGHVCLPLAHLRSLASYIGPIPATLGTCQKLYRPI